MSEFLTTRELAALLRVKERKVYDLVASKSLPMRRVTGKLLFPRLEIEQWIAASAEGIASSSGCDASIPMIAPIFAGGHDPLLEWALRESRCGIAALLDGAVDGLARFKARECLATGLHIPSSIADAWNVDAVRTAVGSEPVVLFEWTKRTRGLMYRATLKPRIACLSDVGRLRFQSRQPEAGSELILSGLLAQEGLTRSDLAIVETVERSETDLAAAISAGRADVGLGIEATARQLNLEFAPLISERFDILVWRKAYFEPPFQKFIRFCESSAFRQRAHELSGYDCSEMGAVHFNGD